MKKHVIALLFCAVLALSCLTAFAETESYYTYYPESEAYVGTWYVDDYILTIDHEEDDAALFDCVVTRYDSDGATGEEWIINECAYDDVGCALSSVEIGQKYDLVFDGFGEVDSRELVLEDFAAAFQLNDDGTLTWLDFTKAPDEENLIFEKVVEDNAFNPMDIYEGAWVSDRASLTIESLDDVIYCTVEWGSSAFELTRWEYDGCLYDEISGGLTTFETGVKTNLTFDDNGEIVSSEEEYTDGAASFIINDEGNLVWTDFKETPGENEIIFEKMPEEN